MRKLLATSFVFLLLVFGAACGGPAEYALAGTARAPGTDGLLTVETIEGGNKLATVELENLPPPDRLGDGMTTYVVWFQEQGSPPTKAGALGYDADDRTGRMTATTPTQSGFVFIITAEADPNAPSPSDVIVVRTEVN